MKITDTMRMFARPKPPIGITRWTVAWVHVHAPGIALTFATRAPEWFFPGRSVCT